MNSELIEKKQLLISALKPLKSLAVAFSGGVDSTLLLTVASQVLDQNVIAVTSESVIHPGCESQIATGFTKKQGIKHLVIKTGEMNNPAFLANNADRCYICKKELFSEIKKKASALGISDVAHGANVDDLKDFRPGFAAAHEMKICAPLIDAGLTKHDVRMLLKNMGLEVWNRPSMPCLATRIPYGTKITEKKLKITDQAENFLKTAGLKICRVRHHGEIARIETGPDEFEKIMDEKTRIRVVKKFREIGFLHIALDLEGYVQGSMNRSVPVCEEQI